MERYYGPCSVISRENEAAGNYSDFIEIGAELKREQVPLPELITAMALSRKMIWTHVIKKNILASPLEIYTTLELNNRIIFIYDKIIYFLAQVDTVIGDERKRDCLFEAEASPRVLALKRIMSISFLKLSTALRS